eukprot:SAG31_NODE_1680_length_7539_cov_29.860484_2_plen_66_part_00
MGFGRKQTAMRCGRTVLNLVYGYPPLPPFVVMMQSEYWRFIDCVNTAVSTELVEPGTKNMKCATW